MIVYDYVCKLPHFTETGRGRHRLWASGIQRTTERAKAWNEYSYIFNTKGRHRLGGWNVQYAAGYTPKARPIQPGPGPGHGHQIVHVKYKRER